MNIENILKVADAIEAERIGDFPIGFDMRTWGGSDPKHTCGTVACVAGYASAIDVLEKTRARDLKRAILRRSYDRRNGNVFSKGRELLGLSALAAERLFLPEDMSAINANIRLVPDALRWMALSGDISWSRALASAYCVERRKK